MVRGLAWLRQSGVVWNPLYIVSWHTPQASFHINSVDHTRCCAKLAPVMQSGILRRGPRSDLKAYLHINGMLTRTYSHLQILQLRRLRE